jgi:peptidyl-prolyl cis-trans isomerase A (cyclophilin A)
MPRFTFMLLLMSLFAVLLSGCPASEPPADNEIAGEEEGVVAVGKDATAPFKVKFEMSNGDILIEIHPEWAPIGATRFKELVTAGYFDGCRFFRVVPGFVVQFGLNGDPDITRNWTLRSLKDDAVMTTNARGTLTFATAGPNTRTTQLFINLADNGRLDGDGFSPFGVVVEGMEIVDKINAEYGQAPDQTRITDEGNHYLKEYFPRLDYIKTATIVK